MANAVLVIDMLRGFLEEGHPLYIGEKSRQIIPDIQHLLEREVERGRTPGITPNPRLKRIM
jgi:nicotinamidase-related amidase